ncbi:MAG: hypothetical protein R3E94_17290 [Burkholderiaceae bacterium]
MAHEYPAIPADQHHQILREQILQDGKYVQVTGGHGSPKAVILAHRGQVRAFHLSKDGQQIAVVQEHAPIGEFSVRHALAQTSEWHLAQAHELAQGEMAGPGLPQPSRVDKVLHARQHGAQAYDLA